MGTDIHMFVEVLVPAREADIYREAKPARWKFVKDQVFTNAYFRPEDPITMFGFMKNLPYDNQPYHGRNYRLFAVLADVRNGRGFAGVDMGERVEPIAEPRDIPEDASPEWRKYASDVDLHSHSWFTVAELRAVDWNSRTIERGVINEAQYLNIKESGFTRKPTTWSGSVSGSGIITVTPEQYEAGERGEKSTYISYQWESRFADEMGYFIETTIPELERLAPYKGEFPGWDVIRANGNVDPRERDYDAVRIVFAFDN